MTPKMKGSSFAVIESLLAAYDTNDRINEYMIDSLDDAAWRAKPPGGKGRDIAAIIAHMHNVRLMWIKSAAPGTEVPAKLEGEDFTRAEAAAALSASKGAIRQLLAPALESDGKIKGFKPDAASFVAYLIAHDAHHRGQASMLARQLGHPLPQKVVFGMWEWGTR